MIAIDASIVFHRAFHKLDFLKNTKGQPTGLEFGTIKIIESLSKKYPHDYIVLVFDSPGATKKKQEICPSYKGNRIAATDESSFYSRINRLKPILNVFWATCESEAEEADSVLFSIAQTHAEDGVLIYSNDNDLLQCVSDGVKVLKSHNSEVFEWDEAKVREKFFCPPQHLAAYRAFIGDSSDNLFGITRISKENLAAALLFYLQTETDMRVVYDRISDDILFSDNMKIKIKQFREQYFINLQLMSLTEVPYTIKCPSLDYDAAKPFLEELEIFSTGASEKCGLKKVTESEEF